MALNTNKDPDYRQRLLMGIKTFVLENESRKPVVSKCKKNDLFQARIAEKGLNGTTLPKPPEFVRDLAIRVERSGGYSSWPVSVLRSQGLDPEVFEDQLDRFMEAVEGYVEDELDLIRSEIMGNEANEKSLENMFTGENSGTVFTFFKDDEVAKCKAIAEPVNISRVSNSKTVTAIRIF